MERVVCGGLAFRKIHFAVLKDSFCRFEGIDLSKMGLVCRGCITSP